MNKSNTLLTKVFWTTLKLLQNLSTFYNTMLHGLTHGTAQHVHNLKLGIAELYGDGTLASLLYEPDKVNDFISIIDSQMGKIHQQIQDDSKRSLDATAIIYAHGILDASVFGYLEVLSKAAPDLFTPSIKNKTVSISDLDSKSIQEIKQEKINEYISKKLERESLMFKLDLLHKMTKPDNSQMGLGLNYDKERLSAFDKARHDIVHGNNWTDYILNFSVENEYWTALNFYLLKLVAMKTNLKILSGGIIHCMGNDSE